MTATNRALYIHVPFCLKKCTYCDFYSVAKDTDLIEKYIDGVCREASLVFASFPDTRIDTVYIGGGTPSILPEAALERLIEHIYKCASVNAREFTIEVNPCSSDKIAFYKTLGINRLSIGVQTLNPAILKTIGRLHDTQGALDALARAAELYQNVSADVMLGLPGQTVADVESTLSKLIPYVKHISMYMLKLSDGVPMAKAVDAGTLKLPDDDSTADLYDAGYSLMREHEFERYEISNFARPGYDSLHNLKYWNREDYIGLGPAAHSFINGIRYDNPADLNAYLAGDHLGNRRANAVAITKEDALFEFIMLRLRLPGGFGVEEINRLFHIDFLSFYKKQLSKLKGILDLSDNRVRMKEDKMLLESFAAREFLL